VWGLRWELHTAAKAQRQDDADAPGPQSAVAVYLSGVKKPTKRRGFAPKTLASIRDGQVIGIRAGTQPHRTIGIWAVVVEGPELVSQFP
jgi:hypothetical protein